jgi:hypothetical protein
MGELKDNLRQLKWDSNEALNIYYADMPIDAKLAILLYCYYRLQSTTRRMGLLRQYLNRPMGDKYEHPTVTIEKLFTALNTFNQAVSTALLALKGKPKPLT